MAGQQKPSHLQRVAGVLQGTADVRGRGFFLVDEVSGRTVQVWVREQAVPLMRGCSA